MMIILLAIHIIIIPHKPKTDHSMAGESIILLHVVTTIGVIIVLVCKPPEFAAFYHKSMWSHAVTE